MIEPTRIVPDRLLAGYPIYGDHFVHGRCNTRFNIAPILNASAIASRRLSGLGDLEDQLTWALTVVEWPVLDAALDEYDDELTIGAIRTVMSKVSQARCLQCCERVDPRAHQHA